MTLLASFFLLLLSLTCIHASVCSVASVGLGVRLTRVLYVHCSMQCVPSQMLQWIVDTTASLSRDHTHIGDSLSSAELKRQAFSDFQARIAVSHTVSVAVSHTVSVAVSHTVSVALPLKYMLMRDADRRKKEASKVIHVKTTKQSNTTYPRQSLFQRKMMYMYILKENLSIQ